MTTTNTAPGVMAPQSGRLPEGVTEHAGTPIPIDADFFYPPPPAIGQLVSAQTTLRTGKGPRPFAVRLLLAALIAAALGAGIYLLTNSAHSRDAALATLGMLAAGGVA